MNISQTFHKQLFIFAWLISSMFFASVTIKAQISSVDSTFNPVISKNVSGGNFTLQPDGKILVYGNFQVINGTVKNGIARLNADGTLDNSFDFPQSDFYIGSVVVQPNQKIVVAGYVRSSVTDTIVAKVLKLNADGSLDNSFSSPFGEPIQVTNSSANVETVQPDGKILVSVYTSDSGYQSLQVLRLNTDGTFDNSFVAINYGGGRRFSTKISKLVVLPNGKILIASNVSGPSGVNGSLDRYNADGTRDMSFESPVLTGTAGGLFNGNLLNNFEVLSDGGIIIVGDFNSVNGVSRVNVAKLSPTGNVDLNFAPINVFQNREPVAEVGIFSNGKILVRTGVIVTGVSAPGTTTRFISYNPDGSVDSSVVPPTNLLSVNQFVIDNADKVLLYGAFTENGGTINKFARLASNGNLLSSFAANYGIGGSVSALAIQTSGKVIVVGDFTNVNGIARNTIARLNADGSLDQSFTSGAGFNGTVEALVVQSDNKILVGGGFTSYNGTSRTGLARLNNDGSLDASFNPSIPNATIYSTVVLPDGRVLIGGDFTAIAGETRLGAARLVVGQISGRVTPFDFDGDGRADLSVFRSSNGYWYQMRSRDNSFSATQFGLAIDRLAPADYDGDGRTDIAVFRDVVNGSGERAYFYILYSSDNSFHLVQFGKQGDVPIAGDWDGDGKDDLAVYRNAAAAGEQSYFFYRPSSIAGSDFRAIPWGTAGDKPQIGDFDGDGKNDAAVFRPSNGYWFILKSSNNQIVQQQFGLSTDIPTPADYDGDGKTNIAVFRPSNGYWYTSLDPSIGYGGVQFGAAGDLPVAADYDGDGRADIAVYRPSGGVWYLLKSSSGFTGIQFGTSEDKPIPNAYFR